MVEITETTEDQPLLKQQSPKRVTTKVPEIKIHLYKQGKGPIDIFTSSLGGWDQDQLEVGDILEKYGLKCLYAFNKTQGTRGVPIRFNAKNGRSVLPYKDGSVICVDGEPKGATNLILGPIDIFTSSLGGWDQDQLEVGDILEKYGLKCLYAFNKTQGTRGVPIRFNAKNGRSVLPYKDGAVICVDGEPKDSLIKPITRILVGVAIITALIVLVMKETPGWAKKLNITGVDFSIPPWVLACVVIVFTRLRKRTRDFFTKTR